MHNESNSAADLAIVGLGPGGLAAAYHAASRGLNVLAFTDRNDYTRMQKVVLSIDVVRFLQNINNEQDIEDQRFWALYHTEQYLRISEIEKYIYRKLVKLPNVHIVQLSKSSSAGIQSITSEKETTCFHLQSEQYYFKHLIVADGAHHNISNLLSSQLNANIFYADCNEQERHPYHAIVQVKLRPGIQIDPEKATTRGGFIARLGWNQTFMPKFYIFTNANKTEFSFSGEIPEHIYHAPEEQKPELLKQWAGAAIKEEYGVDIDDLTFPKADPDQKDSFFVSLFKIHLEKSSTALYPIPSGQVGIIGDARRSSNYILGHGLNDAIEGGITFSDCIDPNTNQFNRLKFISKINQMEEDIVTRMKSNSKKEQRERHGSKLNIEEIIYKTKNSLDIVINELTQHLSMLVIKEDDLKTTKERSQYQNAISLLTSVQYNLEVMMSLLSTSHPSIEIASLLVCIEACISLYTEANKTLHPDLYNDETLNDLQQMQISAQKM